MPSRLTCAGEAVASSARYTVFDEWWSQQIKDHMPAVINREARAGRVRAITADKTGHMWVCDDYVYNKGERLIDDTSAFTWRLSRGRHAKLRRGVNGVDGRLPAAQDLPEPRTAASGLDGARDASYMQRCGAGQPEGIALAHFVCLKHELALQALGKIPAAAAEELRLHAAHATTMILGKTGIYIQSDLSGREHFMWFSGQLKAGAMRVNASALSAAAEVVRQLGAPTKPGELAGRVWRAWMRAAFRSASKRNAALTVVKTSSGSVMR